jgi:hypothetical protein
MIRGFGNAVVGAVIATLLDKYFHDGLYAGAAVAMLRHVRHALGF